MTDQPFVRPFDRANGAGPRLRGAAWLVSARRPG